MRPSVRWRVLSGVLLVTFVALSTRAIVRIGGTSIPLSAPVRVCDVSAPQVPVVRARAEDLLEPGSYGAVHDGLFVAVGSEVRLYDRRELGRPPIRAWSAGAPVLDGRKGGLPSPRRRKRARGGS